MAGGGTAGAEGSSGSDALVAVASDLARSLQVVHGDVEATLQMITARMVEGVPGAQHAGITLVTEGGRLESRATTGPLPEKVDALQGESGQGPCLQALWSERTVQVTDMATETRWPLFASRALEVGVASMLCFQLFVRGHTLGGLNLHAEQPRAFTQESVRTGRVFATHAAIALSAALEQEHLRAAVDSHTVVGQATGIVMERYRIPAEEALEVLSRASQDTNTRLRRVAESVVTTGSFGTTIPAGR